MRNVTSPLVFHSDRGIQFVSQAFQKVTEGMINSYSKKAYPWDNACIESFHSLLKREWLLLFVIGAAGVGGYLYIKMKGVKPASKKNQPDPDADYHDEDEDTLQLPEDDGDEDEEVDVNEDYEAESDDEPV